MAIGPRLTINTLVSASTFARMQVFRDVYTGWDGKDYTALIVAASDSDTDTLYLVSVNPANVSGYSFLTAKTGLTKYLKYSFTTHLGMLYFTNGTDAVGLVGIDEVGALITARSMTNAPKGTIIISAKNTLWIGGDTYLTYSTGTAIFTVYSTTVTGIGTTWTTNLRAGDFIGTGASPSTWYTVASIQSNTTLTLTIAYAGTTTASNPYVARRDTDRVVYWGAQECSDDFITSGVWEGFNSGSLILSRKNTGLHNILDSVLMFTDQSGHYIDGITPDDWQIPKATRIPVGCVSHNSIISKNGLLAFASEKGIYITSGGTLTINDLGAEPYSDLISPTWANVDPEMYKSVHSFIYKDSLLMAVPDTTVYSETDSQLSYSTGTVSCSDATTTVTGSSTLWRGKINIGDQIRFNSAVDGSGLPIYYTITAIATGSSGNLTIDRAKSGTVSNVAYKVRKRRCNRILVLDTRTNLGKKWSLGWTVLDGVNPDGFCLLNNVLLYGSSTSGSLYKYNTGGQLYGAAFTATAITGRMDFGAPSNRKLYKAFTIQVKGVGKVYITPYVDGTALTTIDHTFSDTTQFTEVKFPSPDPVTGTIRPFSGRGREIYYKIETRGSNESVEINFPQTYYQILPTQ